MIQNVVEDSMPGKQDMTLADIQSIIDAFAGSSDLPHVTDRAYIDHIARGLLACMQENERLRGEIQRVEETIVRDFFERGIAILDKAHSDIRNNYPKMFEHHPEERPTSSSAEETRNFIARIARDTTLPAQVVVEARGLLAKVGGV